MNKIDLARFEPKEMTKPVSDPERSVRKLEGLHGFKLVADYRRFVIQTGAPIAFGVDVEYRPIESSPWDDDGAQSVEVMYGLGEGEYSLSKMWKRYADQVDHRTVPVGAAPGGNQLCLVIAGSRRGQIYFWDHEGEFDQADEGLANMYLVARSFSKFVDSLAVVPRKNTNLDGVVAKLDF